MRNLIQWMLDNCNLPTDFDALRKDMGVMIAAKALGVSVEKMAIELQEKREQKKQASLKLDKKAKVK